MSHEYVKIVFEGMSRHMISRITPRNGLFCRAGADFVGRGEDLTKVSSFVKKNFSSFHCCYLAYRLILQAINCIYLISKTVISDTSEIYLRCIVI